MGAMRRLKLALLAVFVSLSTMTGGLIFTAAPAAAAPLLVAATLKNDACSGLSQLDSSQTCGGGADTTVGKAFQNGHARL